LKGQKSKVSITRLLNAMTGNQQYLQSPTNSRLCIQIEYDDRITDMHVDLKGQNYNVTLSVWCVFAHNSTAK